MTNIELAQEFLAVIEDLEALAAEAISTAEGGNHSPDHNLQRR